MKEITTITQKKGSENQNHGYTEYDYETGMLTNVVVIPMTKEEYEKAKEQSKKVAEKRGDTLHFETKE